MVIDNVRKIDKCRKKTTWHISKSYFKKERIRIQHDGFMFKMIIVNLFKNVFF